MPPLNEEERENLVAYLDGEVDEETARAIEARINVDPQARAEADSLKQAWDLLEFLPRPEPSSTFTNRTMERLALNKPISTMSMQFRTPVRPKGSWAGRFGWVAVWVLAGIGGFALALWFAPRVTVPQANGSVQVEQVLEDNRRVIKYKDLYDPVPDLEFLKQLDHPDLFGEVLPDRNAPKLNPEEETDQKEKARLYQKAQAFMALSPERQEQLRQLDTELHRLPLHYRKALFAILERHAHWLRQLTPAQRQHLEQKQVREERLESIRQVRQEQWITALPRTQREQLAPLEGEARQQWIAQVKQQQLKWQIEWYLADRNWNYVFEPVGKIRLLESFEDLKKKDHPETWKYVNTYLKNQITQDQWLELDKAQGNWPWFPYLLVKLADEHPLALPGASHWPQKFDDLPKEIADRLSVKKDTPGYEKTLTPVEGKWPDFAGKIAELLNRKDPGFPRFELWPIYPKDLNLPVRNFLDKDLRPVLTPTETGQLLQAEGRWPDYPQTIQQLAKKHYLTVPWQSLPGPPVLWDNYRLKKSPGTEQG